MKEQRKEFLKNNFNKVLGSLTESVKLIIVSKYRPSEEIEWLYELGHRDFGENKVQELYDKSYELKNKCPEINWHFIGRLQSNKVKKLLSVPSLKTIHSIDSPKLLHKFLSYSEVRSETQHKVGLFFQVNTSEESEKGGFNLDQDGKDLMINLVDELLSLRPKYFNFQGLMTMSAIRTLDFNESAHNCFKKLSEFKAVLHKSLSFKHLLLNDIELSIGMSRDYEIALKYDTDYVRVGTSIFGKAKDQ